MCPALLSQGGGGQTRLSASPTKDTQCQDKVTTNPIQRMSQLLYSTESIWCIEHCTAWPVPLTVCTSQSVVSNTIMITVEDFRNFQVRLVGSEVRYRRVNTKLANLEVDPLFYKNQLEVFRWRMIVFEARRGPLGVWTENRKLWFYMATKCFEEAPNTQGFNLPDGVRGLGNEAQSKFRVPVHVMELLCCKLHMKKDLTKCRKMGECCEAVCPLVTLLLSFFPEAGQLTKLAIRSKAFPSLKEMCMRRVLDLELEHTGSGNIRSAEKIHQAKNTRGLVILCNFFCRYFFVYGQKFYS